MAKLLDEIKYDLSYLRSHTLQPQWFKVLKLFILLGVLAGYTYLFEWAATLMFFICFMFLGIILHLTYRAKTEKFTRSWLDFVVFEENGALKTKRIGKFYYSAVAMNALLAFLASQWLT